MKREEAESTAKMFRAAGWDVWAQSSSTDEWDLRAKTIDGSTVIVHSTAEMETLVLDGHVDTPVKKYRRR